MKQAASPNATHMPRMCQLYSCMCCEWSCGSGTCAQNSPSEQHSAQPTNAKLVRGGSTTAASAMWIKYKKLNGLAGPPLKYNSAENSNKSTPTPSVTWRSAIGVRLANRRNDQALNKSSSAITVP